MYRYYSTQRPVGPGTFPGKPEIIVNYDHREKVLGIGPAWGHLEYKEPLDDDAIEHYELKPAGLKKFVVKVTTVHTLEVEAENEDKATEKACGMAWEYDADSVDGEIVKEESVKIVTQDDIRYTEQTEALNEIAAKLGVVAYRPDYHGSRGDKNTVMFYTAEDEKHNRMVNRQPVHYSRGEAADLRKCGGSEIPDQYIYRDSFWNFENSDVNDLFDMSCANRGKVDLRGPDWKERLEGCIGLALLRKRQHQYIRMTGGWWELREADEPYNDFNRSIIAYMKKAFGSLYLGNVNFNNDDQRKRICADEESVYEEYTGQKIYNFHCTFAVPRKDEALEELIREWNRGTETHNSGVVDQIMARVDELGGEHFLWY